MLVPVEGLNVGLGIFGGYGVVVHGVDVGVFKKFVVLFAHGKVVVVLIG